jgi:hypothetical protein
MEAVVFREDDRPVLMLQQEGIAEKESGAIAVPDKDEAVDLEVACTQGLVMHRGEFDNLGTTFQGGFLAKRCVEASIRWSEATNAADLP